MPPTHPVGGGAFAGVAVAAFGPGWALAADAAGILQYSLVFMACSWGYRVLGPVVARTSLGGPAAWGEILVAESLGLVVGAGPSSVPPALPS
ncbi:hypothetical protein [Streptomyces sp. NPDC056660]|uniref:hypothetical protein n=1 Tax=Streptomyces sp. NPDC056660 TaxID=3345897 RepID=UPI0036C2E401